MEKVKLEFLKRILLGCISDDIKNVFFETKEYPSIEIINNELSKNLPPEKINYNSDFKNSYTMVGFKRLCNVHNLLDHIRENNIDGDFIETGVWKGGVCIFIAEYIRLYKMDKKIYVADSFDGLPRPNMDNYHFNTEDIELYGEFNNSFKLGHLNDAGRLNIFHIPIEEVKDNFKLFNLLNENVVFIKGWFKDSLKNNKNIKKLSMIRLDGDLYSSTMDVLNNLYDNLSKGGFVIVDDYGLYRCKQAVDEFRNKNNINDDIQEIDGCGVFWLKK